MQVKQYLFQSPYSSPVQFGRVDPSSKESSQDDKQLLNSTNQTANKAQVFQSTQTQEVTPTVSGKLDVYA